MQFVPGSPASVAGFVTILVAVIAAALAGIYVGSRRQGGPAARRTALAALGLAIWLGLDAAVVGSGVAEARPMPLLMLFFAANNLLALGLSLSPVGGWIARGVPLVALIGFQAFRLPLELVLHAWATEGTIPETMTWTGQNYDIVSGAAALVAALVGTRFPMAIRAANVIGLGLLGNVMRVAILSSPLPFAWPVAPPLQLGFHLPYAFIVPVCVGGALAGHVVLMRGMMAKRAE